MFDGSSIAGWKGINESDMILMPDASTAVIDPFFEDATVNIRCDVIEPATMQGYERDPRSLAKRAEAYLKSTGIADAALFGPENEFFIFDSVRWGNDMHGCVLRDRLGAGRVELETRLRRRQQGHRPGIKGGYFPVPPVDAFQDIRAAMCKACEEMGLVVEVHHHEVATGGQCEIGVGADTLVKKADEVQILKYALHNVGATLRQDRDLHAQAAGRRQRQRHARAPVAVEGRQDALRRRQVRRAVGPACTTSAASSSTPRRSTRSPMPPPTATSAWCRASKRPVMLAYSARNRSASIRMPWVSNPKARRIEVRFPDSTANPYFAFAAMMMAGLDGIQNKIHPGDPADKDLYDLEPEEAKHIPTVCHSLDMALEHSTRTASSSSAAGCSPTTSSTPTSD